MQATGSHRRAKRAATWAVAAAGVLALALGQPAAAVGSSGAPLTRTQKKLEVLGVWSGVEQRRFHAVLREFERRHGVDVTYTSVGRNVATALDERIAARRPPDVAMVPQPGLIRRLAHEDALVPLDASVLETVERNYAPVWRRLGSVGGALYGVWFKAANKSLVWYNVASFEQLGVVPPRTLDGLVTVADAFADHGVAAFSLGAADGWTLTDWFENVYVATAGPRRYDQLTQHRIPWTDPSVEHALDVLGKLWSPRLVAGGVERALGTTFEASVEGASGQPPDAAMVFEGDFVAALLGSARRGLGEEMDLFAFPGVAGSTTPVIGGGDAAVLLRRSAAGRDLVRFLATPRAAAVWAAEGGFVSPNQNLDLAVYPDIITRSIARRVVEAGDNFRFDLSDAAPAAFGAVEGQGIRRALQEFLLTGDSAATAQRLEAEATVAYAR